MQKVTLIIPTFNRFWFLRQAIDSFLMQDYQNKELIVVDDGSNPPAEQAIHPNVKYIRIEENKGCPAAINAGIRNSESEFICVLGDDDMLYDEKSLSNRIEMFLENTEVVYTSAQEVNAGGVPMKVFHAQMPNKDKIWMQDYINIHSMMWRRSIHEKIGLFSEDMISNEDWEFKIKCLMECSVLHKDIITVKYRWHSENKSMINHRNGIMGQCKEIFMKRLKERYANN